MLFALNSCRSGSHFYRFFCDHLIVLEIVITALSVKGLSLHARPNYLQNRAQILFLFKDYVPCASVSTRNTQVKAIFVLMM